MTRAIAFVQARMSSSRLPGKVLAPLGGQPMILYMARRVLRSRRIDGMVIITSTDASDDELADVVASANLPVFRGSLDDVLHRYVSAAAAYGADEIIRLTGDCPLIDPAIIDAVIDARRASGADYSSNVDPPTFPDGLDTECCTFETLARAHQAAKSPAEREHVTLWMRSDANGLKRANVRALGDMSHLRLTVDYADDLEALRRIVAHEPAGNPFDLFDILRVLSLSPDILAVKRLTPALPASSPHSPSTPSRSKDAKP